MRINLRITETVDGVTLTKEEALAVFILIGSTSEDSRQDKHLLTKPQAKLLGNLYSEYDHAIIAKSKS